jgi:hypothetical protein
MSLQTKTRVAYVVIFVASAVFAYEAGEHKVIW